MGLSRAVGPALLLARGRLGRYLADDCCYRAVIRAAFGAETPQNVIGLRREVDRLVTLCSVAETPGTGGFAAAVVVRNKIVLVVHWIPAGTDPGNR